MNLILLRIFLILVFSFIAVCTDVKSGNIYNCITYPMIIIGLALNIIFNEYIFISIIGAIVLYLLGLILTKKGLGGGDIKLFIGIYMLLPMYHNIIFILYVMLISTLISYVYLLVSKKKILKYAPYIYLTEILILFIF